uniref:Uncharacterized protein n=1 Tax=Arundo donax TaxID=35708 RepID=A0A0A9GY75_ARUDO
MAPNLLPKRTDHILWHNKNIISQWLCQDCRCHAMCWHHIHT